jgi:hypothetical protein
MGIRSPGRLIMEPASIFSSITIFLVMVLFFYIKLRFDKAVKEACAKESKKVFAHFTPLFLEEVSAGVVEGLDHLRDEKILNEQQLQAVDLILNKCIQNSSSQHLIVNRKQKKKFQGPNYKKAG